MLPPVPNLDAYGLNPDTGFLPLHPPLRRLPSAYDAWEDLVADLQPLILTKRLRTAVENLSVLSTDQLHSDAEWRRAYVVLVFLLHAYVWGENVPAEVRIGICIFSFFFFLLRVVLSMIDANNDVCGCVANPSSPVDPPPQGLRTP